MSRPRKISYGFMVLVLFVVASLHLATPLLTVLFSLFALHLFTIGERKAFASGLFLCLCTAVMMGLLYFFNQAVLTTPLVLDKLIPVIMDFAAKREIVVPFTDVDSFKKVVVDTLVGQYGFVGASLENIVRQSAMFIIGVVVAISLYANAAIVLELDGNTRSSNLYALSAEEIAARFKSFYKSFGTVMGAQIIISGINTFLTALFIIGAGLPYASLLVVVTFLCGLLPILGNIISNTIIISVALTISPGSAGAALAFLVFIHKLEYFLNSKIIGSRIKNPMWMTLLALVLGEALMGVPGMILAPVILHYIKTETSKVRVVRQKEEEIVDDDEEEEDKLVAHEVTT